MSELYTTKYSSQGALQNEVMPRHVDRLMLALEQVQSLNPLGIINMLSGLRKLCPPFQKAFKDYSKIMEDLEECQKQYIEWRTKRKNDFPTTLATTLFEIYEQWWNAYNMSGAGITYERYVSRNQRTAEAIRRV